MINSKDEALSSLPKTPIQMGDKVFPARDIINSLIANQNYILNNTNNLQSNIILDKTANWNTLEPQTTFQFNGLGTGAPDKNILNTDTGIVTTFSTQNQSDPLEFQIVLASTGLAYRVVGQYWSYLGHQVPNNVDADNLIDRETLSSILTDTLKNYVSYYQYGQDKASQSDTNEQHEAELNSATSSLSANNSVQSSDFTSFSNQVDTDSSNTRIELASASASIEDNYDSISGYEDSTSSLNEQMNGSLSEDGYRYYGVYGKNGLSSVASENQNRLDSSNDSMVSFSASLSDINSLAVSIYGSNSYLAQGMYSQIENMLTQSQIENLPDSVAYNTHKIKSLKNSLGPLASQNAQLLDSIATTTYTNSYANVDIVSEQSLSSSSNPSNFAPIISDVYLQSDVAYEFKANIPLQSENVAKSPNYANYEDVTGTIGFTKDNADGIDYQLLNREDKDIPVPHGLYWTPTGYMHHPYTDDNGFSHLYKHGKYVDINYPYTNLDISNQLEMHLVDIIFVPKENEKLNIISVPARTELEPPTYTNIQLIKHAPITTSYNTNSLVSATATSMSELYDQYNIETSVNNTNIVLNNRIANNALSGASQADSYLASAPRVSLAPTYSYANSCSNQTSQYVFFYPQYDNDKEEKAIDWCLSEITPQAIQIYGKWKANTPTKVLVDQCKNLTAGIIANIMSAQLEFNGAVADPQNPNKIQDWTYTNYLNWNLTSDYDKSSILNYLNSTLKRVPNQEWDGWEAYLGLHAKSDVCASWLADQIKNPGFDVTIYANQVRKLLY